jgi:hypothetical protein
MGKKSKTPITVNNTEYFKEDMSLEAVEDEKG